MRIRVTRVCVHVRVMRMCMRLARVGAIDECLHADVPASVCATPACSHADSYLCPTRCSACAIVKLLLWVMRTRHVSGSSHFSPEVSSHALLEKYEKQVKHVHTQSLLEVHSSRPDYVVATKLEKTQPLVGYAYGLPWNAWEKPVHQVIRRSTSVTGSQ